MSSPLRTVLIYIAIVGGLLYWVGWSLAMVREVAEQESLVSDRDKALATLRANMVSYKRDQEEVNEIYKDLNDSQTDLLCAARYGMAVPTPSDPEVQIKEVVLYRDKITACPTADPEKAELYDPNVQVLRPVNEIIAITALDNAWKAYCVTIKNEDESCAVYR